MVGLGISQLGRGEMKKINKKLQRGWVNVVLALFGLSIAGGTVYLIYLAGTDGGENTPMSDLQDVLESDVHDDQGRDENCERPDVLC